MCKKNARVNKKLFGNDRILRAKEAIAIALEVK